MDVDVIGGEVGLAGGDEAVAGEVDEASLVTEGSHCSEPLADVGDGGLLVDELVDVLGWELPPPALMRVEYISSASRLG